MAEEDQQHEQEDQQKKDPAISVEFGDGQRVILRLLDFRGTDDIHLRRVIGMTSLQAWNLALAGGLDALAGLIWVMRRRADKKITFESIAEQIGFTAFDSIRDAIVDDIEALRASYEGRENEGAVELDPEAPGAS